MEWYKSSYSIGSGNCVEIARTVDGLAVRDSKNPDGGELVILSAQWAAFTAGVKTGRFE